MSEQFAEEMLARIKSDNPKAAAKVGLLRVREGDMIELTVAEIIKICDQNPNHPKAIDLRSNCSPMGMPFPPNLKLVVEKVDVEAVLRNKNVVHYKERSTLPAVPGGPAQVADIERKALEDDPNIPAGSAVSPVPFN